MKTMSVELPYDYDVGELDSVAVEVLCELDRLAGSHIKGQPRLLIVTTITGDDFGTIECRVEVAQLDGSAGLFDWLDEATDAAMPSEAVDGRISLEFKLDDAQAMLLKASWPSELPRLYVDGFS